MEQFGSYSIESFGRLPNGTEIQKIQLSSASGMVLEVLTLGGTIHRLLVPTSRGTMLDVILGKETLPDYLSNGLCNSSIIGRNANRISNAAYKDHGTCVQLEKNFGVHSIHGGDGCYAAKIMSPIVYHGLDEICLELQLLDSGDGGFPGFLHFSVTYCLSHHQLRIIYKAVATKSTPWNPTSHAYFDLNGHGTGTTNDHRLQIFADHYLPSKPDGVPTGEIRSVLNTDFDFKTPKYLKLALQGQDSQLTQFGGFDHNFCIDGEGVRQAAILEGVKSGIQMQVWTDRPGIQLFTLNQATPKIPGKEGKLYGVHDGICLETQHYPDAVNNPKFPNSMIPAGVLQTTVTVFCFHSDT